MILAHLPLFARIAVEWLDADATKRTPAQLDAFLDAYAGTYGVQCDPDTRAKAHRFCAARFPGFATTPDLFD